MHSELGTGPMQAGDLGYGGVKVDFGIGLSYRPLSLGSLVGRYDNPMPELTLSPSQGLRN